MSHMKALIAGFALLMSGISPAQAPHPRQKDTKSQCNTILKVDSIVYAKTKDETIDSVTVCDDGKATAVHSFTAPAFGAAQPEPTKWDYSGEIDKDALSDLKKIVQRTDIAQLPERVNAIKTQSPVDVVMRFTILDQGTERHITLHVPSIGCGGDRPEMPKAAWDLICLFADLYNRAKAGTLSPEKSCECKSLHEMAVAQQAGLR
jgi:hypothetical protein